ncbi:hypothetical protein OIU34_22350 [Pararhizobium sp. BT-229]|uniref:hypothetical protein n=1 Tax=Pararhizobium sp. BT-229 TaxID=2986923 RepID=UPI0021F7061C|nr:hypothetical protein [Pararhizobium sp. BT-229]MCV9964636.1 hypothetical protein [Pararhizobium sp. BT-229]
MTRGYNSNFPNGWETEFVKVQLNFTGNSSGKKVFDWNFAVAGKRDRIPVEVKAFHDGTEVWFGASSQYLPGGVKGTDINKLKQEVLVRLTEQVTLLTNIEWEDWYEVIVTGDNSDFADSRHSALGADLKIQVNRLKRGIDPATGRELTIINGAVTDFPSPSGIDDNPDAMASGSLTSGIRYRSQAERSYIPATPENRRAIDSILARMEELRNSIAGLLSQENIEESLVQDVLKSLPKP